MTDAQTTRSIEEVERSLLGGLTEQAVQLPPRHVQILRFVDGLGQDAWRIVLVLPRPEEETWDREAVFATRRAAELLFDRLVAGSAWEFPGRTLAVVTTDEAREDETARDDEPEPGEDPWDMGDE